MLFEEQEVWTTRLYYLTVTPLCFCPLTQRTPRMHAVALTSVSSSKTRTLSECLIQSHETRPRTGEESSSSVLRQPHRSLYRSFVRQFVIWVWLNLERFLSSKNGFNTGKVGFGLASCWARFNFSRPDVGKEDSFLSRECEFIKKKVEDFVLLGIAE